MEKIREHIEGNLKTAGHAYDDASYRLEEAKKKLKEAQNEVSIFSGDLDHAQNDLIYYQELLNELNEKQ
jgi:hypothetical protein